MLVNEDSLLASDDVRLPCKLVSLLNLLKVHWKHKLKIEGSIWLRVLEIVIQHEGSIKSLIFKSNLYGQILL